MKNDIILDIGGHNVWNAHSLLDFAHLESL